MRRRSFLRTLCLGSLYGAMSTMMPVVEATAQSDRNNGQGGKKDKRRNQRGNGDQLSAQQAAKRARERYGGQVLKVNRRGSGYDVRLLQDDGRVITVFIGG